jgi:hypothetical protein
MKQIICIASLIYLLMLPLIAAQALEWDFGQPKQADDWEPATGEWSIKDNEYSQDQRGMPAMRSFAGDNNWTDYTVEAKIKITENSYAGLIFRAQSELEYQIFYLNVGSNVVEWWEHAKPNPDTRQQKFKHAPEGGVNIQLNEWYHVKIIADGDDFEFYINDELQDAGSSDIYPKGRIGLWAWDTKARFDDVKVNGEGIPETSLVQTIGKLTTCWGQIKTR